MSDRRQEFPAKVKLAAWQRCGGHCEIATCQAKLRPGKFAYDHVIPAEMDGPPTLDNCQVICEACDKPKTAKDQGAIAKAKRRELRHAGIRKHQSRPLPGTRASGWKHKMTGEWVRR